MLKLKKIAITGGISSGKTTVCEFFKQLGAYVVSSDELVHQLLNPHTDLGEQILRTFGVKLLENGQINRKKLAEIAFQDASSLQKLEQLLHPKVFQEIERLYEESCKGNYPFFVVEIPLLYEIGKEESFDAVIAVLAEEEVARKRFSLSPQEYDIRMKRQLPQKQKAKKAHYIIYNNGTLEELKSQVLHVSRKIMNGDP